MGTRNSRAAPSGVGPKVGVEVAVGAFVAVGVREGVAEAVLVAVGNAVGVGAGVCVAASVAEGSGSRSVGVDTAVVPTVDGNTDGMVGPPCEQPLNSNSKIDPARNSPAGGLYEILIINTCSDEKDKPRSFLCQYCCPAFSNVTGSSRLSRSMIMAIVSVFCSTLCS